jgi:hypothetical protein
MFITKIKDRELLNIAWEEEQLERFEFLGPIATADGKIEQEINHRVEKANKVLYQLANITVGNKELKEDTKMRRYKTVFVPTLRMELKG